ncbi:hypothetical protein ES705_29564 [subsurface metagenome]
MEFESNEDVKKLESFKTLETVFAQQCEVVETGDNLSTVEIKEKPEGDKIINSPHNTDAEYVRKRNQKVTETQYGDAGFVNGKTIISSEEKGIDLEGPSSGRSQS